MAALEQQYKRNENFVFRQIEDETILVPIKNNVGDMHSIYSLNDVGAFLWRHLDGEHTLANLKELLTAEYEVTAREAEADLIEFVGQLRQIDAILGPDNGRGKPRGAINGK